MDELMVSLGLGISGLCLSLCVLVNNAIFAQKMKLLMICLSLLLCFF